MLRLWLWRFIDWFIMREYQRDCRLMVEHGQRPRKFHEWLDAQYAQALVEYALLVALLTFIAYFALWWVGIDVSIMLNEVRHALLGYE